MKVVYAVDAIFPPLTGIGRYAYELARRLSRAPSVTELRYLAMLNWVDAGQDILGTPLPGLVARPWVAAPRRWLATQTWAIAPYDFVSERVRRRLLSGARGAVYHSPNYFLSPYDGPSVATVHDLSVTRFPETHPIARRRYFDRAFERSLQRASLLITVSETVRQELIADYGLSPDRVRAVLNGVDASFRPMDVSETASLMQKHGLVHGGYTLSVATMEPRKKLDRLIMAYAQLPAVLRKMHPLVLIGATGWLSSPIQILMDQARAQGWLKFLGYVPQQELPALYAGARGYAMTSIYEGFGLPILEAMASGVPVLTSNVSCMPEVAGGAALLAHPDDLDGLREQLHRLLTDDVWRSQAVVNGLRRAGELTWERCLDQTLAVYREVA